MKLLIADDESLIREAIVCQIKEGIMNLRKFTRPVMRPGPDPP